MISGPFELVDVDDELDRQESDSTGVGVEVSPN
jgi:hypothetical protein